MTKIFLYTITEQGTKIDVYEADGKREERTKALRELIKFNFRTDELVTAKCREAYANS